MADKILLIGILISLFFSEIVGLSPAGIIVPAYLALYSHSIDRVIYTIIIALITYFIIKFLSNYSLIYGKRSYALCIIISFLLNILFVQISKNINTIFNIPNIIGILIPGIIANEFIKQGIIKSIISLFIVMGLIMIIMILFNINPFV
ncbi:MAG: poly-gamma-glutamate biosynthesis protein PgsC [Eubacteriales bacterium]|nr:poly-gamma-glutamate biosynthesis protein PgsC [Eubacteriales bacterium]